jgi:hypothetical protein
MRADWGQTGPMGPMGRMGAGEPMWPKSRSYAPPGAHALVAARFPIAQVSAPRRRADAARLNVINQEFVSRGGAAGAEKGQGFASSRSRLCYQKSPVRRGGVDAKDGAAAGAGVEFDAARAAEAGRAAGRKLRWCVEEPSRDAPYETGEVAVPKAGHPKCTSTNSTVLHAEHALCRPEAVCPCGTGRLMEK